MRVVAAGLVASTARTVIETPLELIKVRRQMGQAWKFNELYRGFNVTWIRTCGLMCTFFILVRSLLHAWLATIDDDDGDVVAEREADLAWIVKALTSPSCDERTLDTRSADA